MGYECYHPRTLEAYDALEKVLLEFSDIFGPSEEDTEVPDPERFRPDEWAIVTHWVALETEHVAEEFTQVQQSRGMFKHHLVGLLNRGLDIIE